MLPNKARGVPRVDDRRVLNGIFWVLRSGAPWRDLPIAFGPYTTCYNRFVRWRRAGVWSRIIDALAAAHDAAVQMIDTSIVLVHQHGACVSRNKRQSMGRSRGGLTSKIHAVVDGNGLPIRLALAAGEANDNRLAAKFLSRLQSGPMLLADRRYDADWIRALVSEHGAWANIPPRRNRNDALCFSPYLYRARNLVEPRAANLGRRPTVDFGKDGVEPAHAAEARPDRDLGHRQTGLVDEAFGSLHARGPCDV